MGRSSVHAPLERLQRRHDGQSNVVPEEEAKTYTASMHDCEQVDRDLIDFILSTVTDESERDDLEKEGKGDARTLILYINYYKPRLRRLAFGQSLSVRK